jgi:hypothetical protein
MHLIEDDKFKVPKEVSPESVVWQDAGVDHVGITED